VNGEQAYQFALANAQRNEDGSIVEKSLVDIVAHAIDFDADKERLGLAQRVVSARKRPGQTAPAGKVALPGLAVYEFEPHRLIADADGNVVENERATPMHKRAEARRSEEALDRSRQRAHQDAAEAELISEWAADQSAAGRDPRELVWGVCVRESGLLAEDGT
jgi:hypothetical protein